MLIKLSKGQINKLGKFLVRSTSWTLFKDYKTSEGDMISFKDQDGQEVIIQVVGRKIEFRSYL